MANVAGSLDPTLPFPFPALEVQLADGSWKVVQVEVGVPAGKTIVVARVGREEHGRLHELVMLLSAKVAGPQKVVKE